MPPSVTVVLPTYNRPQYLPRAIKSVIDQNLTHWELLVINDGGCDVSDIIEQFNDPRIIYLDREKNQGKAACCNIALHQAEGKYVAYLDDDDMWYPNHLEVLSGALDRNEKIGLAYSNLLEVPYYKDPQKDIRIPIGRRISHSYPFDLDLFLSVMSTLHVSLMHRKDLALKAGGYDESLRVMIDRNISLKLAFYSDFLHVPEITGEYWVTTGESDRISDMGRQDTDDYLQSMRKIKGDHPPKPWKNIETVSVIFPVHKWDSITTNTISTIADCINYPCEFILVDCSNGDGFDAVNGILYGDGAPRNIKLTKAGENTDTLSAYLLGAENTESDFIYLASPAFDVNIRNRIIKFLDYWKKSTRHATDALRVNSTHEQDDRFNFFIKKSTFIENCAAQSSPAFEIETINEKYTPDSCQIFGLVQGLESQMSSGHYQQAHRMLDTLDNYILTNQDPIATIDHTASYYLYLERYDELKKVSRKWVQLGYGGDTRIYLGKALFELQRHDEAAQNISTGIKEIIGDMQLLEGVEFPGEAANNPLTKGLSWLGDCFVELGSHQDAAKCYNLLGKLCPHGYLHLVGLARICLKINQLERASKLLLTAVNIADSDVDVIRLLGRLSETQGRIDNAYKFYYRAYTLANYSKLNIAPLFRTGSQLEKWQELKPLFTELDRFHPSDKEIASYLNTINENLGESPGVLSLGDYQQNIFVQNPPHTAPFVREAEKVGRNEKCPCGSGKKYKNCCYHKEGKIIEQVNFPKDHSVTTPKESEKSVEKKGLFGFWKKILPK